ncbi:NAD(P)H-dependent oxidoreductase [Arthrobacter sp. 92]|uniref:NAD(P)H-dependent oxidoreductase n=1 Tax=Arthrobacter sp. 92 TaxID=3418175 RepID=UPI003D03F289
MSKSTVLALVGSLRADSHNRKLAEAIQLNAPAEVDVVIHESLGNVPFYNEDIDVEGQVPAAAAALRAAANDADTLLLVTPEHNGTVPASLKNAIDWLSRPYGAGALSGKPTAVVGTAFGQYGGVWAQDEARKAVGIAGAQVLEEVKLAVPASMIRFAEVHPKDDAEVVEQIKGIFDALAEAKAAPAAA